jgi:hypothetical protein
LPAARQKAQKLQKIFSVAAGDHAHKRLLRSHETLLERGDSQSSAVLH